MRSDSTSLGKHKPRERFLSAENQSRQYVQELLLWNLRATSTHKYSYPLTQCSAERTASLWAWKRKHYEIILNIWNTCTADNQEDKNVLQIIREIINQGKETTEPAILEQGETHRLDRCVWSAGMDVCLSSGSWLMRTASVSLEDSFSGRIRPDIFVG